MEKTMQKRVINAVIWASIAIIGSLLNWSSELSRLAEIKVANQRNVWELGSLFGVPLWVSVVLTLTACAAAVRDARRVLLLTATSAIVFLVAIWVAFAFLWLHRDDSSVGPGIAVCLFAAVGIIVTAGIRQGGRSAS